MSSSVHFYNNQIPFVLKKKGLIRQWIKETIENEGKTMGEINYMFGDDEYVLHVNQEFLHHDYFTDIITFDYCEQETISGDIVISVTRVKENAHIFHVNMEHELHRVMIHGILHLCGYKDKTKREEKQMREKENFYLQKFPVNNL